MDLKDYIGAFLIAQLVKKLPAAQETQVQSLGREDPLEKDMAAHSTVLAWEIPGTEEPWGHKELDTTKRLNNNPRTPCPSTHTHIHSNISPSLPRIQLKSGIFHLIKDNNYMQYTVWHTVHAQLMVATVNSIIFFFLNPQWDLSL